MHQLKQELEKNYRNYKLSHVCSRTSTGDVSILCFVIAKPLLSLVPQVRAIIQEHNNALFPEMLASAMRSNVVVKLADIPKLWNDSIRSCQELLVTIKSQAMKLEEVDRQFLQYRQSRLEDQVVRLHQGVRQCTGMSSDIQNDEMKLRNAVKRMHLYWELSSYRDTANTFLKIRDALKLEKRAFIEVERLSKDVSSACTLHVLIVIEY